MISVLLIYTSVFTVNILITLFCLQKYLATNRVSEMIWFTPDRDF